MLQADIHIRTAENADSAIILEFIQELALYEKLEHEVFATEEILIQNLFGEHRYAECLIAEVDHKPAGFAIFFHNFSTFLGKPGLYLEDLFVKPDFRGLGIGIQLLQKLARIALERNCGRMEWWVLNWNESAINFYRKLGAEPMNEWTVQRLTHSAIEKLAENK